MTTKAESKDAGAVENASEAMVKASSSAMELGAHLAQFATDSSGRLTAEAHIQMALRSTEGRAELLEQMVREITPCGMNERLLLNWIEGGFEPFNPKNFAKGDDGKQKPGKALTRVSTRVVTREGRVAKARVALEAAQHEFETAEEDLNEVVMLERNILQWHIVQQLVDVVGPVFAMGPAWTILRALSAHVSPETAELHLGFLVGKGRKTAEVGLGQERIAQTDEMMEALDFFSGDAEFEDELRNAVLKVVKNSKGRRAELEKNGRKPRSKAKRMTEVHPAARHDADLVVDGLKRAS